MLYLSHRPGSPDAPCYCRPNYDPPVSDDGFGDMLWKITKAECRNRQCDAES